MPSLKTLLPAALALFVTLSTGSAAEAQKGLALKVGGVFNSSTLDGDDRSPRLSEAAGWNVGAEYVLPGGLGVGVSGYTSGSPSAFDTSSGSLVMLGDITYFLRLPLLPIAPYVGVHVGLGTYRLEDIREGVRPQVDFGDRGYQYGVRFQPTALLGVDAQIRRVSGSLAGAQDTGFETRQVVLGVTIF